MNIADLPKVELHLHHEGAAPPDFIRQLAAEKKMDISNVFDADGGYAYRDFWHFLEVYEAATSTLTSPEDYHRLTLALLEESAKSNVIYCESFISPDFCGGGDVGAWLEYLHAIREAADIAEARHGIVLRGIATAVRHFGPDKARNAARCAAESAGDWLCGFGIGGDEKAGQLSDFAYAFDMARESGLRLTAHAGEWGGPESVRDALDSLRVERIGHGVQAWHDPDLVKRLARENIVLEVCPGSNVFLGVYRNLHDHPIVKLRESGVEVTVSTDDPPFFRTDMNREYRMLDETFGWDAEDFTALNIAAANAAFCNDEMRAKVLAQLETRE